MKNNNKNKKETYIIEKRITEQDKIEAKSTIKIFTLQSFTIITFTIFLISLTIGRIPFIIILNQIMLFTIIDAIFMILLANKKQLNNNIKISKAKIGEIVSTKEKITAKETTSKLFDPNIISWKKTDTKTPPKEITATPQENNTTIIQPNENTGVAEKFINFFEE